MRVFDKARRCGATLLLFILPTPSQAQSPAEILYPPAWAAFARAWSEITAYSATVTIFEQKGTQVQNSVFEYHFRKPSNATVGLSSPYSGVTIVWEGGLTVDAHRGSGLMALFKKRFSLHDPQMMTIRGLSVDEGSFGAILAHSQGAPRTISQGPGPTILGVPTVAVTLVPLPSIFETGVTHEIVDISTMISLPLRVLGYEGETLVRQIDFSDIKLER